MYNEEKTTAFVLASVFLDDGIVQDVVDLCFDS